jgi:hypothetical protein
MSVEAQVKDLFSESTHKTFIRMFMYICALSLRNKEEIMDRISNVDEFAEMRDAAMRALYVEIGILKGETRRSRFKKRLRNLRNRVIHN